MRSPAVDPGVHPDTRSGRQREVLDPARRRREVLFRVLGGQPGLDRVPTGLRGRRGDVGERAARRDVQLQLDDVDAGGHLGHGVLDLQPGVDLQERQQPFLGLVEELDGAGVDVARSADEIGRRGAQQLLLIGVQRGGGGLLDDLLVAPLHRAVADAEGPHVAGGVPHDLHLDMTPAADRPLQEHGGVTRGLLRLRSRPLEGLVELVGRLHPADPAPAAARGGLDHQRVADPFRVLAGLLHVGHRATAPRGQRHAGLLGQPLRRDLVPEPVHHLGRGTDEDDVEVAAQAGEVGLLGHEAPSGPHRVGARRRQRPLQLGVVEVGGGPEGFVGVVRADQHGLVRLADEHRVPVHRGVQRDRPQWSAPLGVPLPDRVDEPHRRLTPVDDGDPLEPLLGHDVLTPVGVPDRTVRRVVARRVRPGPPNSTSPPSHNRRAGDGTARDGGRHDAPMRTMVPDGLVLAVHEPGPEDGNPVGV